MNYVDLAVVLKHCLDMVHLAPSGSEAKAWAEVYAILMNEYRVGSLSSTLHQQEAVAVAV